MTCAVPILMYHSVKDDPPVATRVLSVRPADLEWQLRFLRDNGFTGLTFGALCERFRTGADLPARPIVLTFDDGYADTHEEALPLLADYGFAATVFVTTGWLHDAGRWATGRPLDRTLVWSQVEELAEGGIEVAAHSHSHPQLDQLSDRELHAELRLGKSLLEDRLGRAVPSLAYPSATRAVGCAVLWRRPDTTRRRRWRTPPRAAATTRSPYRASPCGDHVAACIRPSRAWRTRPGLSPGPGADEGIRRRAPIGRAVRRLSRPDPPRPNQSTDLRPFE